MATSVPVPMAIPTSAWASAGASLMPSPTMPTRSLLPVAGPRTRPCRPAAPRQRHGRYPRSAGNRLRRRLVVAGHHHHRQPHLVQLSIASRDPSLIVSATPISALACPSTASHIVVRACRLQLVGARLQPVEHARLRAASAAGCPAAPADRRRSPDAVPGDAFKLPPARSGAALSPVPPAQSLHRADVQNLVQRLPPAAASHLRVPLHCRLLLPDLQIPGPAGRV
jgi:hypothetical protein